MLGVQILLTGCSAELARLSPGDLAVALNMAKLAQDIRRRHGMVQKLWPARPQPYLLGLPFASSKLDCAECLHLFYAGRFAG